MCSYFVATTERFYAEGLTEEAYVPPRAALVADVAAAGGGSVATAKRLRGGRSRVIARIWRGWTTADNADAYQRIVGEEVAEHRSA